MRNDKLSRLGILRQAYIIGYRQTRRQFDRSKIGIFWIPLHYLLHVFLIGFVFRYVWKDDGFLVFFSYSYLSWRLLTDPIQEGATFWRSAHSTIWYIGVKPKILVFSWFISNFIKTGLWLISTLIFTGLFLQTLPKNILGFFLTIVLIRLVGSFLGYIFSFIAARFWEASETITSVIQLAYLLSPVFWKAERLGNYKWVAEINPIYYLMELPRNFAMGNPNDPKVILIAFLLAILSSAVAYICHKKFSKKVVMWVN